MQPQLEVGRGRPLEHIEMLWRADVRPVARRLHAWQAWDSDARARDETGWPPALATGCVIFQRFRPRVMREAQNIYQPTQGQPAQQVVLIIADAYHCSY